MRWNLLGLAAAVLGACQSSDVPDDWITVRRDVLILDVEVTGTLEAVDTDVLGPPPIPDMWDFKIAHMAPEGEAVDKGVPVLAFDTSELMRQLEEKQNERDAAAKELEKKRLLVEMELRDQELALAEARARLHKAELVAAAPEDLTSALELKKARIDLALAQKEVAYLEQKSKHLARRDQAELSALRDKMKRAEDRVREIQDYIARMAIQSRRQGTVIYTTDRRGEKKKVGDSAWRAAKVLEVASLDRMKARGEVDEVDVSKLAVGQPVSLRLDAHPDVEFAGKIASIAETVQRKSPDTPLQVVRVDIELATTEPRMMRPGMRFRGTVETGRVEDALIIPVDAVFLTGQGPVAYRQTADGYEAVKLTIGQESRSHVEIKAGLGPGDRVSRTDPTRYRAGPGAGAGAGQAAQPGGGNGT